MSIFSKIIGEQTRAEITLGNPLNDESAIERRLNFFAQLRDMNGFRQPSKVSKGPKRDSQGKSRRDRREERFQRAFHPVD